MNKYSEYCNLDIVAFSDCFVQLDPGVFVFILLSAIVTCRCGQAASNVGSSSSGSNSAPLGLDEGGKVRNKFIQNWNTKK